IRDLRFPHDLSRLCIEGIESSVDDGRDDLALVNRESAIHHAAADFGPDCGLVDLGIPSPTFLARARIDREDNAPVGDSVQAAIPLQQCCLLGTASGSNLI